jgi:amphiphysin
MGYAAVQYKDAIKKLDEMNRTEMDETFRMTVLDPLGKLIGVFPEFTEVMKKRDRKLLDYDRARSAVKKLVDSPSTDPSKLPKAESEMQQAKGVYDNINNMLMDDIPKLVDMRVPYLEPCFEAMIKMQLHYNQESYEKLEAVKKGFEYGGKNTDGHGLEGQAEAVLQQIRSLTICGGS